MEPSLLITVFGWVSYHKEEEQISIFKKGHTAELCDTWEEGGGGRAGNTGQENGLGFDEGGVAFLLADSSVVVVVVVEADCTLVLKRVHRKQGQ